MWKRNLFILAILSLAFVSAAQAQWHPDIDKIKTKTPRGKTVAKTKPKTAPPKQAHDRYANQEVSYLKSEGNEGANAFGKSRKKTTTNVWGDPHVNERRGAETTKPNENPTNPKQTRTSQIFMEGGNDSWNTRKKPTRGKSSRCIYPVCGGKTSAVHKLKSAGNEVAIESLERKSETSFDKGTLPPAVKNRERQNQAVFEPNNEPLWANAKRTTKRPRARKRP